MEMNVQSISENQFKIGGKDYKFIFNLEKMKVMEKIYKVNLIQEISQGVAALPISTLEVTFIQGIVADNEKRTIV